MLKIRKATSEDMESVYLMGYDVWGENMPSDEYITMCNQSSKYKKGTWYILENPETKEVISSLIVYELPSSEGSTSRGIGSIATPFTLRKRGYASALIQQVIQELERNEKCTDFFLYSDIGMEFYNKLKFIELPPAKQKYKDSICMYYSKENDRDPFEIPDYF
ncbi:GNAT family N-acetyltransferase [Peribacillus sp. NPDC097225]|uniref:GNAT family N-acetyltransferase n=1 Tax=Peribacillus sp. NPDC097225 TaxID=3364400 RepID=UPI003822BB27